MIAKNTPEVPEVELDPVNYRYYETNTAFKPLNPSTPETLQKDAPEVPEVRVQPVVWIRVQSLNPATSTPNTKP